MRDSHASRRLSPRQRRSRLLEVGLDVFAVRPLDLVSTDEIAARARISSGLLYHYFPDKRGFYLESLREAVRRMEEVTAWSPGLPWQGALRASLRAQLRFAAQKPGLLRLLASARVGPDREAAAIVEESRQGQLRRMLEGLGVRDFTPAAHLQLHGWLGHCEALTLAWLADQRPAATELVDLLAAALDPALRALGVRPVSRVSHPSRKPRVRLVAQSVSPAPR